MPNTIPAVMSRIARATAVVVGLGSCVVLLAYAAHVGMPVDLGEGRAGMSPLTAIALLSLATGLALDGAPSERPEQLGWVAILVGAGTILVSALEGRDVVSPVIAARVFQFNAGRAGVVSVPTAICLMALGIARVARARPRAADRAAAVAVVIAGFTVLEDLYDAGALPGLPLFGPMAPHTALAILLLALASLTLRPDVGWAAVIASSEPGGASTRRLIAFTPLPPLLGWVLLRIADAGRLGLSAAMAALVVLTIVPLALLVLRGGRILDELEGARKTRDLMQVARDRELRLIADAMPVLIAFVDRTLTYRFANNSYKAWFGLTPEQIVGRRIPELLDAEAMADRRPYLDAALAGREARFELPWPLLDGRARDAEIHYLPRVALDGTVEGFFIFVADITERKAAERRLVATNVVLEGQVEARTRERDQIWQSSKDMLCIATQDGYLISVNPAWTETLGWSPNAITAEPFINFVHPDDVATTMAAASRLARGEPALAFENRYRHSDGGYRWLSWNAVPNGALVYATIRDVTEAKAAAERERTLEEALRQSQKMEAVGQLTGGLAHDFNNLLTGITGSLDLLALRVLQGRTSELGRYIDAAQGAAQRAAALTHRLLAFSRRQTLDPKPTDLNRLIVEIGDLVRRTVGPEVAVEIVAAADLWSILVDPNQLENALLNLCINARDAMPGGGGIIVETENLWLDDDAARANELQAGAFVALHVSDTGTGMTPEVIARVFDPFFTTKPLGQGTGLGLSMIYGFARQSGGQVAVASEVGRGTRMSLYLPRYHGPLEQAVAAKLAAPVSVAGGETMLIVDDEPTVRMLVTDVLEELGYRAIEAADGAGGLAVLRSNVAIDLLVTDIGLPGGMNGRQLAEAARAARPGLRVLFITGYAEAAVIGNDVLEPGMRVLTKPFAMDALGTMVKQMIETP